MAISPKPPVATANPPSGDTGAPNPFPAPVTEEGSSGPTPTQRLGPPEGTTNRSAAPSDADSAKQVVLAAAQSGSGIVRLTTQAGNDDEVGALVTLTGSSDVIGAPAAAILTAAGIGGLTGSSTWDAAVTAIGSA